MGNYCCIGINEKKKDIVFYKQYSHYGNCINKFGQITENSKQCVYCKIYYKN